MTKTPEEKAREYADKICAKSCRTQCEVCDLCTIYKERMKNYLKGYHSRDEEVTELREALKEFLNYFEALY